MNFISLILLLSLLSYITQIYGCSLDNHCARNEHCYSGVCVSNKFIRSTEKKKNAVRFTPAEIQAFREERQAKEAENARLSKIAADRYEEEKEQQYQNMIYNLSH